MVPWLKDLIDTTLRTNDVHKVMIGMDMIVEGLARGAFNNMYKQTEEPLLKSVTFNVMRDESRHVSFGHVHLAPIIAAMHPEDREDLAQFAFDAVQILMAGQSGPMDVGFPKVLEVSGIEVADFQAGMQEAAELGILRDLPPGQIHSVKDLMLPALVRAGHITRRSKALFEAAGIPVNADLTILEAMEDRKSTVNVLNAAAAARLLAAAATEIEGASILRFLPEEERTRLDLLAWLRRWAEQPEAPELRHVYLVMLQDIGAEHAPQQQSRQAHRLAARVLAISADAIVNVDEHMRIDYVNASAERLFRYGAGQLVGRPLADLLPERFRALTGERGELEQGMLQFAFDVRDASRLPCQIVVTDAMD